MNNTMNIMNNSYLYTDLGILRENAESILSSLPRGCGLIPVLKDDAYGLGLSRVAAVLEQIEGVCCAAVAHVSEGLVLRSGGFAKDILVMGSPLPFQLVPAVAAGLTLPAGSKEAALMIAEAAKELGLQAKIHIKVDIGLHRIGVEPGEELGELCDIINEHEALCVTGAFSHFSNAENEESSEEQYELFLRAVKQIENAGIALPLTHISCSAASELYPERCLGAVRVGRRLYMDRPEGGNGSIKELASWRSYITAVKQRRAGDSIGYGGRLRLERDSLVATVGVGYGDGLQSALCEVGGPVLIKGQRCRLLASCMDQCLVDVTGLDCAIGDEVTFFGYDSEGNFLSSQEVALLIGGDEGCGLTSALSTRVARVYSE